MVTLSETPTVTVGHRPEFDGESGGPVRGGKYPECTARVSARKG